MGIRKVKFVDNEYYHLFNRGVDKRVIFENQEDLDRFFLSMKEFNVLEPIGSIYENAIFKKRFNSLGDPVSKVSKNSKIPEPSLVEFVCYCLNPNHYHFIIKQLVEKGIEKFMHKLGLGYAAYFNQKYKRSGSLFEGRFKAIHIDSEAYLLHLSAYVNLNYQVHFGDPVSKIYKSSWGEYLGLSQDNFCQKDIVLNQFDKIESYKKFAEEALEKIKERKELKKFLLE